MAAKAKSFDGLAALLNKTSFKENKENNKSKISFNESIVPRRQKLRISQAGSSSKLGSKSQILRRHTLHDRYSTVQYSTVQYSTVQYTLHRAAPRHLQLQQPAGGHVHS